MTRLLSITDLEDIDGKEGDEEEGRGPQEPLDEDFPDDDAEVGVVQPEVVWNEVVLCSTSLPLASIR